VTAYDPAGAVRYGVQEPVQRGVISTAGSYLYVPRSDDRTVVADLGTGRVLGRPAAAAHPFQDPDTW
jgi:hypothetical protein